jgi:hypothetical protein
MTDVAQHHVITVEVTATGGRMSKRTLLVVAIALAAGTSTLAPTAAAALSETELPKLVADCNGAAESGKPRAMRACATLEEADRLSLVEQTAVIAYQKYKEERLQTCLRRQASPRGQSRDLECGP